MSEIDKMILQCIFSVESDDSDSDGDEGSTSVERIKHRPITNDAEVEELASRLDHAIVSMLYFIDYMQSISSALHGQSLRSTNHRTQIRPVHHGGGWTGRSGHSAHGGLGCHYVAACGN